MIKCINNILIYKIVRKEKVKKEIYVYDSSLVWIKVNYLMKCCFYYI